MLRASRKEAAVAGDLEASTFISLKRGIGDLVTYTAHRLKNAELTTERPVTRVALDTTGRARWVVETARGPIYAVFSSIFSTRLTLAAVCRS